MNQVSKSHPKILQSLLAVFSTTPYFISNQSNKNQVIPTMTDNNHTFICVKIFLHTHTCLAAYTVAITLIVSQAVYIDEAMYDSLLNNTFFLPLLLNHLFPALAHYDNPISTFPEVKLILQRKMSC